MPPTIDNIVHLLHPLPLLPAIKPTHKPSVTRSISMKPSRNHFLISLLFAFAFCIRILNAGTLGIFTYEITGKSVAITDISHLAHGNLVIPSLIEGKPVTTIGANACSARPLITSVTLPSSIKSIGDRAFNNCMLLAGATFNGNAPQMGERVFGGRLAAYDFKIFVADSSKGFSVPRWLGYRLSRPKGEVAVHGFYRPYLLRDVSYTYNCRQVPVGDRSTSHEFKLTNVGNRPLRSIHARIKGEDSADFLIVVPAKSSLAPGKSTTVKIVFSPRKKGKRQARLELKSSDSNEGNYEIQLSGTGIDYL